jgi:signal transduction histidine kinase
MRLVVENAAESMPDGGVIVISMRATAGEVTIEVVDRGEGLVAIGAEQAFLPLQSTKPGHAGLGLAMVRRIVRRHGGRCELAAAPSGGTAMCMSFPNPQEIPNDVVVAGG